jgi:hypothetical protein
MPTWIDRLISWLEVLGLIGTILASIYGLIAVFGGSPLGRLSFEGHFDHIVHAEHFFVES